MDQRREADPNTPGGIPTPDGTPQKSRTGKQAFHTPGPFPSGAQHTPGSTPQQARLAAELSEAVRQSKQQITNKADSSAALKAAASTAAFEELQGRHSELQTLYATLQKQYSTVQDVNVQMQVWLPSLLPCPHNRCCQHQLTPLHQHDWDRTVVQLVQLPLAYLSTKCLDARCTAVRALLTQGRLQEANAQLAAQQVGPRLQPDLVWCDWVSMSVTGCVLSVTGCPSSQTLCECDWVSV